MHVLLAALSLSVAFGQTDTRLHVLFVGDRAYHQPEVRLDDVWGPLARRGIVLDWEDDLDAITSEVLDRYDCVVMYANHPAQSVEPAAFSESLDAYIRAGGGFAALHCTSGCFMDSPSWISLIGARFQSHGSEVFAQEVVNPEHPITRDWTPFETWDETYVQQHVRDNRTLLTTRGDEPWCWTRSLGDGRIFYTASGHDHRTWTHPGWVDHLERAIVWAAGPLAASRHSQFKPVEFDFEPHDWVPNYEAHDPPMPFQLASTPEQATAALIPAAGFHAELFASEPLIVNPLAMTWDERGRCWVIESPDYPNDTRDNGVGTDRISVLEDTDGDGMADSKTVFAENLNLPTGLLKVTGGLIVASPPHLLFYEDVDGDDQADRRATLLTGFGTWDTHAGPSNLAWGPDNNVWGAIGYAGYKSEDGPTFASGLWRWDQAKLQPEFVAQFTNNTWGLGLRSDGEIFGSTANGAPSFFVGAQKPDLAASLPQHPGAAIAADSTIVHAALPQWPQVPAHWPERMAFIAEPTAHLVGRQEAYPDKSGFRTRDCFNLVASTDEWFCPVQAEVGPDGAIWIADLAQFIILHNLPGNPERGLPKVDYGTGNAHLNPLRDQTHGRIYRLIRDDSTQTPDLSGATVDQLIAALSSDNRFWRTTARRLLVEGMYAEAEPSLHELARGEHDLAAAEAIRTLHGLGMLGGRIATATLAEALRAPMPATRHAALASLPRSNSSSTLLLEAGVLEHSNAATRRHAYLAASRLPESDAIGAALAGRALSETHADPWITLSLTAAAAAHPNAFVAATAPMLDGPTQPADLIAMVELARAKADGSLTRPGQRTLRLEGGRIAEGERVFRTNTIAACFRCHSLDGSGTGVGPDLSTVGGRLSEAQLLESILSPNAALAEGWTAPASAMPALAAFLSDDELRDVVAFLSAQQ
jgi:type 1 glutamine amidotransferase/cytochrome c553